MTRNQERKLNRIKEFFTHGAAKNPPAIFQVEPGHEKTLWLTVRTHGPEHIWADRGAFILIGERGSATIYGVYDFGLPELDRAKHYACCLGGKVAHSFKGTN